LNEYEDIWEYYDEEFVRPHDPKQKEAEEFLAKFFDIHKEEVFFSRQIEVQNEAKFFHWVTNRALGELEKAGKIKTDERKFDWGGSITLIWHKTYRYPRRKASALIKLVEEYSSPEIGGFLGLHGETMVIEAFARNQFLMIGRNVKEYKNRRWNQSEHNLDFIFERDGIAYGIEVKNTLGYMDHDELITKKRLCLHLGIRPVFVVRMIPKTWIHEVNEDGGYVLILKYQLYPWTHKELAKRVAKELQLPVDAPKTLHDGTMQRFLTWHNKNL
jgi:hypothetical protein